jgi:hypothetical protein
MLESTVFSFDARSGRHVLRIARAPWSGTAIEVALHVCQGPFCACTTLDFERCPVVPTGDAASTRFGLDLEHRVVYHWEKGPPLTPETQRLADAVCAELQDDDWERMLEHFLCVKHKIVEKVNLADHQEDLASHVLQARPQVFAYTDFVPFAADFPFAVGAERWIVDEEYCGDPDCSCRTVGLCFQCLPQSRFPWRRDYEAGPLATYDYTTRRFDTKRRPGPGVTPLPELVAAMKRDNPAFDAQVKGRHGQIKELCRRVLATVHAAKSPRVAQVPVGRNILCPCGSGKKYKHCCALLPRDVRPATMKPKDEKA